MTLPDLPPPTLVADEAGLGKLLEELAAHAEIAVDTEADSFYSYREKVCLVQVSVEGRDYLVDPLARLDLGRLGKLFADPRKLKVFHDGEYDISILKREWGFRFAAVFDTRVAAAALGMQAPGLASVLAERFDVELDKSMQRSNWAQRPLSERQISYARLDTHFLIPLMRELRAELDAADRSMIVASECRRLEDLEPAQPEFNPEEWVRVKGARQLTPKQRRIVRELFLLRDELARASDQPPFRVMNNALLVELSRHQPRSPARLTEIHGFTSRLGRRIGDRVLRTIARAAKMPPIPELPRLPRRDGTSGLGDEELELFERLKRWRKGISDREGIEASYLLNRHVMLRLAQERPRDEERLAAIDGLQDWQLESYAEGLLEVLARFERDLAEGRALGKTGRRWRG